MAFSTLSFVLILLAPTQPTIELVPAHSEESAFIRVVGLDDATIAQLEKKVEPGILTVVVVPTDGTSTDERPAVLGKVEVQENGLTFRPRFDFEPGVRYRVRLDARSLGGPHPIEKIVGLPSRPMNPITVVEHVYPSTERLPTNMLRFYVVFSRPMSQRDSYQHVQLLKPDGEAVDLPFLELEEELWDAEGKRMTLYIDPGRIKREVQPREDLGPVFEPGKKYTLVIARTWKDAQGLPLKEAYRKSIVAVEPFHGAHDPKDWKITSPPSGSREPLIVQFPRPLDQALVRRMIRVVDRDDTVVPGSISVDDEETTWRFLPRESWPTGTYQLVVDTALEDIAGNRIDGAFEVDVFDKAEPIQRRDVKRWFHIK